MQLRTHASTTRHGSLPEPIVDHELAFGRESTDGFLTSRAAAARSGRTGVRVTGRTATDHQAEPDEAEALAPGVTRHGRA